jgi:hypothetical protein
MIKGKHAQWRIKVKKWGILGYFIIKINFLSLILYAIESVSSSIQFIYFSPQTSQTKAANNLPCISKTIKTIILIFVF